MRRLETLQKTSRQKIGRSREASFNYLSEKLLKEEQLDANIDALDRGPVGTTTSLAVLKLLSAPGYGDRRCILHRCHFLAENTDTMIAQEPPGHYPLP